VQRCIASILRQTYPHFEIVVVGDACTDETFEALAQIKDPRIVAVNLPVRGNYPQEKCVRRWQMAGTAPFNTALGLARGDFITHLDDDDEYLPDRLEQLVAALKATRAELIYHPFLCETEFGWIENPARAIAHGHMNHGACIYHAVFKHLPVAPSHLLNLPADWHRFLVMKGVGVASARLDRVLTRHYWEGSERGARRQAVLGGGAGHRGV
jgi:glycosyltransferase involved in cell wall biosynthesis